MDNEVDEAMYAYLPVVTLDTQPSFAHKLLYILQPLPACVHT